MKALFEEVRNKRIRILNKLNGLGIKGGKSFKARVEKSQADTNLTEHESIYSNGLFKNDGTDAFNL